MDGVVIGNYQIVRKLGEGGMGSVYLAHHTLLGRRAALKVLLPALSSRPDVVNRFFNEARATTSISDAGIVQIFDFGYHSDGSAFIVMEYLEGEGLDTRLARLGRLPVYDALRLCRQIATSLAAAHAQRIVHRDLKPENIFLVRDAEVASGERAKILDFGIAKMSDDHPGKLKTSTGALMGTPVYMSPEQCHGASELDHRSDIYALGCVLFHLVVGSPPFDGDGMGEIIASHLREPAPAPSSRCPGIAPAVDALVLRCLAKSPADRFQDMTELARALGQLVGHITSPDSSTVFASTSTNPPAPPPYVTPAPANPTTLGASVGQVAVSEVPAAPRSTRKAGVIAAMLGVIAAAAIATTVVVQRQHANEHREPTPAAAPTSMSSLSSVPPADAASIDAHVDTPPDAAIDAAIDAAVMVDAAVVVDAPAQVPVPPPSHRSHTPSRPRPQPGPSPTTPTPAPTTPPHSGSAATPAGCDRSIDSDCDGIPDVR